MQRVLVFYAKICSLMARRRSSQPVQRVYWPENVIDWLGKWRPTCVMRHARGPFYMDLYSMLRLAWLPERPCHLKNCLLYRYYYSNAQTCLGFFTHIVKCKISHWKFQSRLRLPPSFSRPRPHSAFYVFACQHCARITLPIVTSAITWYLI
jgi:hypothetical protein